MLREQLFVEFKRSFTPVNVIVWLAIIISIPVLSFFFVKDRYQLFLPVELFQEMIAFIFPMLFPALVILICLPMFVQEKRNHFILYTRPRVPLNVYLLSKGIVNALFVGIVFFCLSFGTFVFAVYIEPYLGIVYYTPITDRSIIPTITFSQLLEHGVFTYGIVYSLWIGLNAVLYGTLAFMLMLVLENPFIALSVPFLFYHIFNFISGVLQVPMFSPVSTIFPFNISQQPLWTVTVPFLIITIAIAVIYLYVKKQKELAF